MNIIDGLNLNVANRSSTIYAYATKPTKIWKTFAVAFGCSALTFLFLLPLAYISSSPVNDGAGGILFIALLMFVGIMVTPYFKKRLNTTLDDVVAKNGQVLSVGTRPSIEKSIIWQSIAQSGVDPGALSAQYSMVTETNCIERKDGSPQFSLGRITLNGTYQHFGFFTISLPQKFAHIFIDADASNHNFTGSNFRYRLNQDERYDLEGSFHDFFDVYAGDPSIARAATYLLTPDVMEKIVKYAPIADIEIVDDKLIFIWQDTALASEEIDWANFLPRAFYLLNEVGGAVYDRVKKYRFDGGSFDAAAVMPENASMTKMVSYGKGQAMLQPTTPLVYAVANTGRAVVRNPMLIWKAIGWAALIFVLMIISVLVILVVFGDTETYGTTYS